jgi:hypothetical protein
MNCLIEHKNKKRFLNALSGNKNYIYDFQFISKIITDSTYLKEFEKENNENPNYTEIKKKKELILLVLKQQENRSSNFVGGKKRTKQTLGKKIKKAGKRSTKRTAKKMRS